MLSTITNEIQSHLMQYLHLFEHLSSSTNYILTLLTHKKRKTLLRSYNALIKQFGLIFYIYYEVVNQVYHAMRF